MSSPWHNHTEDIQVTLTVFCLYIPSKLHLVVLLLVILIPLFWKYDVAIVRYDEIKANFVNVTRNQDKVKKYKYETQEAKTVTLILFEKKYEIMTYFSNL